MLVCCEPSPECVLGAVGLVYLAHADPSMVRLGHVDLAQPRLGEMVLEVRHSDGVALLARRVYDGLRRRVARGCRHARHGSCRGCDGDCASRVLLACASDDPDMPQAVHAYARLCFERGPKVADMLAHDDVARLESIARHVINECEHTRQFVRFSQLLDGSFFARFSPNANTIPLVARYFSSRMGGERFCILDPVHLVAALHEPGEPCQVIRLDEKLCETLAAKAAASDADNVMRELWRTFYQGLTLPGRTPSDRGYDLRAHWMPKRFWPDLPELW